LWADIDCCSKLIFAVRLEISSNAIMQTSDVKVSGFPSSRDDNLNSSLIRVRKNPAGGSIPNTFTNRSASVSRFAVFAAIACTSAHQHFASHARLQQTPTARTRRLCAPCGIMRGQESILFAPPNFLERVYNNARSGIVQHFCSP